MKKRPIGFVAYDNEQKPQPLERESKIDYVAMALDAYLEGSDPCDDQNDQHHDQIRNFLFLHHTFLRKLTCRTVSSFLRT